MVIKDGQSIQKKKSFADYRFVEFLHYQRH